MELQPDPLNPKGSGTKMVMLIHSNGDTQTIWGCGTQAVREISNLILIHTILGTHAMLAKDSNQSLPTCDEFIRMYNEGKNSIENTPTNIRCIKRVCKKLNIA